MILRSSPRRLAAWLAIVWLGCSACADAAELLVSAAASLTNAFKDIGSAFEQTETDTKVIFNFAASGPLLAQIERGAPVDVFATADQDTMNQAAAKGLIQPDTRSDFAANQLVLVTPAGSKLGIHRIQDLTQAEVKRIAIGNPATVPVGRYTRQALARLNLLESLQARFVNADSVRQVVDYVARGEVDAGFVFLTDALVAKDKLSQVANADLQPDQPIRYPIAVVASSKQPALAIRFIRFVTGPEGRRILNAYGFTFPE